jgi:DNA-directed RNA polymerase subunit beta
MKERSIHNIRFRKHFGRIENIIDIPNLIDMQRQSYERFLQKEVDPEKRETSACRVFLKAFSPSGTSAACLRWNSCATVLAR